MILQALYEYSEYLQKQGELPPFGWNIINVSYALIINSKGQLENIMPLGDSEKNNKYILPFPVVRTSKPVSNFLCDNSKYLLGLSFDKEKKSISLDDNNCFSKCRELHNKLLANIKTPTAEALKNFFNNWEPSKEIDNPIIKNCDYKADLLNKGNIIFYFDGNPIDIKNDKEINRVWENYFNNKTTEANSVCLITGVKGPVETIHPKIKGVLKSQSSGASIVSFNCDSFCSYGKEQCLNAPISSSGAIGYTSALNYLLSNSNKQVIGDTTVIWWAKDNSKKYQDFFTDCFFDTNNYTESDLAKMMDDLCHGNQINYQETLLNPEMDFYILGLSPNASRLSIRFFSHNNFSFFIDNINKHYNRAKIIDNKSKIEKSPFLDNILKSTLNQKSNKRETIYSLSGEILWSILNNLDYPSTLINAIELRIKATRNITWSQAATIKAYYLKKSEKIQNIDKEVLTVSLNEQSNNKAYNLGRLFSILETIQERAIGKETIKNYFDSASATPSIIFPILLNLSQKHLQKLEEKTKNYYQKLISEILEKFNDNFPKHLSLQEQGSFQLGYYHQKADRYTKKSI